MREITGLKWVERLSERPSCIPQGRPRGAKRQGVKFEETLAPTLGEATRGVWFRYEDAEGRGFAQVDFLWSQPSFAIVGEAKLTWRAEAYVQLRKLYFPLVQMLLGVPVGGMVLCKNLTRETPKGFVVHDVARALEMAQRGMIPVYHRPF